MRTPIWIALLTCSVGCKGEPLLPDAKIDAAVDAFQPSWWTPRPGDHSNWDLQLAAPFDVSAQRELYILDLWAVAPASTITYADSSTVSVPAGPLAGAINTLHAAGTKVACHLRAGAVRLTADPDAMKFPGYEASPPDKPTPPAENSVIGWHVGGGAADERYLDIREPARAMFAEIIEKRIELAASIGCDGVVLDRNDRYAVDPGWGLVTDGAVELSWHMKGAADAHAHRMGAGTKNSYLRGFLADLAREGQYDFGLVHRCAEFEECENLRPYLNVLKAVYAVEIKFPDSNGEGLNPDTACPRLANAGVQDGLMKEETLDSAYALPCNP